MYMASFMVLVLGLPIHYGEVVKLGDMTCGVGMVRDEEGGPNTHKDINKAKGIFMMVPYSRRLSESFKNLCVKA